MNNEQDPESERKTEPAPSLPPCCEHHCEAIRRIEERYVEVLEALRRPPWLSEVMTSRQVASVLQDHGAAIVRLHERVDALENGCEERHQGDPLPSFIPPSSD